MNDNADEKKGPKLEIHVNRKKYGEDDGVKPSMTGAEIAALVHVPADNAVVWRDSGPAKEEVGINDTVQVHNGDQFLVTRQGVNGGYDG